MDDEATNSLDDAVAEARCGRWSVPPRDSRGHRMCRLLGELTIVSGTSVSRELACDTMISYRYFDYNEPITIEVPEGFE